MFTTELDVEQREDGRWRLNRVLIYMTKELNAIVVHAGFVTDFASIPKIVPRLLIDVMDKNIMKPSVVHDYLYTKESCGYTRKEADCILRDAMIELGMPSWRANLVYTGVRLGGASYWKD